MRPTPLAQLIKPAAAVALMLMGAAGCAAKAPVGSSAAPPPASSESAPSPSEPAPSPSPTTASPAPPSPSKKASPSAKPPAATGPYVFPVSGSASYGRTHGLYPASDIFAPCGAPVVAVTNGVVLEVSRVDRYSKTGPQGPYNGGLFVSLRGDDGVRYYGSHLSAIPPGIEAGARVSAGTRVGSIGHTGLANNVCHLHFAISPPCAGKGDWWVRRGTVWPWPYLDAWRAGTSKSPLGEVTTALNRTGCPATPPA